MVAVIALSVVFTSCNKDVYVNPSTDSEYILVTDENGKKVLSEDGELVVYVTDVDGKKVKDDNGEYVTEIQGFVGQIEENGVIEDYAYYFTLPDGWKAVNDRGEFENKKTKSTLKIQILEETLDEAVAKIKKVYDALDGQKDKTEEEYKILNSNVRERGVNIPPLVNTYMGLSAKMKSFGYAVCEELGGLIEFAIMVPIYEMYEEKKARHIETFVGRGFKL